MADICKFGLSVTGPRSELNELKRLLTLRPERLVEEGTDSPGWVLRVAPEAGGEAVGHKFVVAWHNEEAGGPVPIKDGRLTLGGWAKWDPPLGWVRHLSGRLPSLSFEVEGWTADECHDLWRAAGGRMSCVERKVTGVQSEQVHEWVRHDRAVVDKEPRVAVNNEFLDCQRLASSQEYREEVVERVALLEQYCTLAQVGEHEGYRRTLADRLSNSEERINDLLERLGVDELYREFPEEYTNKDQVRSLEARQRNREQRELHRYRGPQCGVCRSPLPAEGVLTEDSTRYCSARCRDAVTRPRTIHHPRAAEDGGAG